jgi:DNA-binding MarR family transcriptional regulator
MKTSGSRFCECLYFTSNALARKVEKMAQENWKKFGLSPSHAYMLLVVVEEPGVQPTMLSEQLQLSPSTITRLIEKLEKSKLVVRTTEGKLTNVYPTPKAKDLYPKMKASAEEFYQKTLKTLGEKESSTLIKSMVKLADKLD